MLHSLSFPVSFATTESEDVTKILAGKTVFRGSLCGITLWHGNIASGRVLYFPFYDLGEEVEPQKVKKLIVNSHIPSGMKSLVILAICLALSGAIYSQIALFFALNRIFFSTTENKTVKQNNQSRNQITLT